MIKQMIRHVKFAAIDTIGVLRADTDAPYYWGAGANFMGYHAKHLSAYADGVFFFSEVIANGKLLDEGLCVMPVVTAGTPGIRSYSGSGGFNVEGKYDDHSIALSNEDLRIITMANFMVLRQMMNDAIAYRKSL